MSPRRLLGLLLAAALVTPALGCGNQGDDYCSTLATHRKELDDLTSASADPASTLIDHLPLFRTLASHAPNDLTDEWQTFIDALQGLDRAVRKSGHRLSDFDDKKVPSGLTPEQHQAIVDAADHLASDQVNRASRGIEQQARDVCKTNIGFY